MGLQEEKMSLYQDVPDSKGIKELVVKINGEIFFCGNDFNYSVTAFYTLNQVEDFQDLEKDDGVTISKEHITLKVLKARRKKVELITSFFMPQFSCTCLRFLRSKEIYIHIHVAIQIKGFFNFAKEKKNSQDFSLTSDKDILNSVFCSEEIYQNQKEVNNSSNKNKNNTELVVEYLIYINIINDLYNTEVQVIDENKIEITAKNLEMNEIMNDFNDICVQTNTETTLKLDRNLYLKEKEDIEK